MKAILLCPGPSLARYRPQPADVVAGVNRAAVAFAVDAWVAMDLSLVRSQEAAVQGSPTLVTSADVPRILARQGWKWRGELVAHSDLFEFIPHRLNYSLFSATTALVYLAWRGAKSIDVYGADWAGFLDFDGVAGGSNRTEARWTSEVKVWGATVGELQQRGTAVRRIAL